MCKGAWQLPGELSGEGKRGRGWLPWPLASESEVGVPLREGKGREVPAWGGHLHELTCPSVPHQSGLWGTDLPLTHVLPHSFPGEQLGPATPHPGSTGLCAQSRHLLTGFRLSREQGWPPGWEGSAHCVDLVLSHPDPEPWQEDEGGRPHQPLPAGAGQLHQCAQ